MKTTLALLFIFIAPSLQASAPDWHPDYQRLWVIGKIKGKGTADCRSVSETKMGEWERSQVEDNAEDQCDGKAEVLVEGEFRFQKTCTGHNTDWEYSAKFRCHYPNEQTISGGRTKLYLQRQFGKKNDPVIIQCGQKLTQTNGTFKTHSKCTYYFADGNTTEDNTFLKGTAVALKTQGPSMNYDARKIGVIRCGEDQCIIQGQFKK